MVSTKLAAVWIFALMCVFNNVHCQAVSPFTNQITKEMIGLEYSYLKMPCRDQGQTEAEQVEYYWFTEIEYKEALPVSDRLFVDMKGDLHFTYLLKADEDLVAGGHYLCAVTSAQSHSIYTGSPTTLVVNPASSTKPVLQYSGASEKNLEGSSATLECVFSGYDGVSTPFIIWHDSTGKRIHAGDANNKYVILGGARKLRVNNLKKEDEGNFYCMGQNTIGTSSRNAVYLNVTVD